MVKKYESKLHKFIRLGVPVLVGASLIGGISYVALVRPIQISNEKKQFEKARLSIEELYTKLEATIGKPDQIKRENYCSYTSAVYGKGARSCDVVISALYENRGVSQSNKYMNELSSFLTGPVRNIYGDITAREFSDESTSNQAFAQSYISFEDVKCGASYSYPVIAAPGEVFTPSHKENFELELSCGGPAKAEHYPLKTF